MCYYILLVERLIVHENDIVNSSIYQLVRQNEECLYAFLVKVSTHKEGIHIYANEMPSAVNGNVLSKLNVITVRIVRINKSNQQSCSCVISDLHENIVYITEVDAVKIKLINTLIGAANGKLHTLATRNCTIGHSTYGSGGLVWSPGDLTLSVVKYILILVSCGESNVLDNGSAEIILCAVPLPTKEGERISGIKGC